MDRGRDSSGHPQPTPVTRRECEASAVRLGDALDDRQAEANARVVGARTRGDALERFGVEGDSFDAGSRGERIVAQTARMPATGFLQAEEDAMTEREPGSSGTGATMTTGRGDARARSLRHPVVVRLNAERASNIQLRVADRITSFAGSMPFVYLHAIAFGVWMVVFERSPWPTLTLVVSLEAIFLSTFVMIGQNRQAVFQQAKADHDFREEEQELRTNTDLTREIHALTRELHAHMVRQRESAAPAEG
jgi:low affinity Fe/Cu permease